MENIPDILFNVYFLIAGLSLALLLPIHYSFTKNLLEKAYEESIRPAHHNELVKGIKGYFHASDVTVGSLATYAVLNIFVGALILGGKSKLCCEQFVSNKINIALHIYIGFIIFILVYSSRQRLKEYKKDNFRKGLWITFLSFLVGVTVLNIYIIYKVFGALGMNDFGRLMWIMLLGFGGHLMIWVLEFPIYMPLSLFIRLRSGAS